MITAATSRPAAATSAAGRPALHPSGLTVLYDVNCPVCRRARRWVERNRQLVPVRFVAAGSPAAATRFPQLDVGSTLVDVTVVTDEGAVLRGDPAWIAVLWAVTRTRSTAIRVANGRHRRLFGGFKGATDVIRRLSAGQPAAPPENAWPPPNTASGTQACIGCRG